MSRIERITIIVFGLLLGWTAVVSILAIEGDEGSSQQSTMNTMQGQTPYNLGPQVKVIRVFPVLTDTQDRFMLIDHDR